MIYTCYEMVRDIRAGRPEGWTHFLKHYVPVIRRTVAHYLPQTDDEMLYRILEILRRPDSFLFQSAEPPEERWLVTQLRQVIVTELAAPAAQYPIDLEILTAALEPLTVTEKQAAWLETMHIPATQAGAMLRVSGETVEKVRARASELLRGKVDTWQRTLLADNGPALGREAATPGTPDCLPTKAFMDVVDGRTTWRDREAMNRHLAGCWHCVDHFCRVLESVELLRGVTPLSDEEFAPLGKKFGVEMPARKSGWKRLFGAA
jgi:hypothetical protein